MKKRTRNRLILLIGVILVLLLAFFMIRGIVTGISSLFTSDIQSVEGYEELQSGGLTDEEISEIVSLPNYHSERAARYAVWDVKDAKERVMQVNCDMDLEPYSNTIIQEDDTDVTMLINKFYALPEGYVPADLVPLDKYACVQGEDFSCQDVEQIELRKEVYDAYIEFCDAASKENINIRAIAGYRSYDYQAGLWNYNASVYGKAYADEYYARPGQSEHNSGLCVDITFNGYNYNEIENYDGYEWILNNAHKYGFILRYPKDKVDVTRYGYESWHFRYVGKEAAKVIYDNDWTLEEYHGSK
ncbi:M15 family metallopeptidase [Faecalitalea cylindroides]|uniref:M15 family metallopeptidase n=1 Tax=Faecalitalea cylindroides TaxID=39483 RepID=UPI001898EA94|nr:M15 family metallopeptidase [Faecalitalea cylindroides]MDB7947582.1 M15 family metallopeptidase [Faecalitalea cylindroides]MDB7949450.1 M15 family metallopeptidase [Faecalitalea cylindroides]MDB7951316.1 M15 family metallopeptidase [Faecalitalea cylindroides]